jgi:hypothetical protein
VVPRGSRGRSARSNAAEGGDRRRALDLGAGELGVDTGVQRSREIEGNEKRW